MQNESCREPGIKTQKQSKNLKDLFVLNSLPETRVHAKKFLRVLAGETAAVPPLWMMRQAGRYLPEYRAIRAKASGFMDFCYNPALACEATLQPITRFGFDAAILFSDILVVPDALGRSVTFEADVGPRLEPIDDPDVIHRLPEEIDLEKLAPVFETIDRVKGSLPTETAFIGFCGAPWTVASYMIAGRGTPDQSPARLFAYRYPQAFQRLIDRLVAASIAYLGRQIESGVEAVQIFDTWAGVLPQAEFERWSLEPVAAIAAGIRHHHPEARIIAFARVCGPRLQQMASACPVDAIGLDSAVDPAWARDALGSRIALQGNLDPLALLAGGEAQNVATRHILDCFRGLPHVFNLGHGILPPTPLAHVETLVATVRGMVA